MNDRTKQFLFQVPICVETVPLPTKCTFMACPGLKTNADFILQLRSMYNFPEKILLGYKLESEEFGKWTMRAATTVMVPRTYDRKSRKVKPANPVKGIT
jgi:hypothetical protein